MARTAAAVPTAAIDGLRGLAVLAVFVCHVVSRSHANGPLADLAISIGGHGVDLFFVISGVCLTLPMFSALREGRPGRSMLGFLVRRFVRIAPAYYVAVALLAVLAFTPFGISESALHPGSAAFFREIASELTFFDSLHPDLNGSFWTLGIEMHWYVLCPLLFALYLRSKLAFFAIAVACYAFYSTPYGNLTIGTLPGFMLGIVAADVILNHRMLLPLASAALLPALIAALLIHQTDRGNHGSPAWHLACFSLVLCGVSALKREFAVAPLAFIGIASYSIYLLHLPVINQLTNFMPLPVAAAIAMASGIAFYHTVERPFLREKCRTALENFILRLIRGLPEKHGDGRIARATSPLPSYRYRS